MRTIYAVLVCSLFIVAQGCSAGFGNRIPLLHRWGDAKATTAASPLTGPLSPDQSTQLCIVTAQGLEQKGHDREAILLYEKARAQDPGAIDYSRRLAVLYDRQQQTSQAMTEYQNALKAAPQDPDVLNDFGYFYFRQGDLHAAEDLLRRAVQIDGNHEQSRINLGIVLAYQGRYEESFQVFAQVVGTAAAYANLGAIMAKQGEVDQAKSYLNQALAMNPKLERQKELLAYLEKESHPVDGVVQASHEAMTQ